MTSGAVATVRGRSWSADVAGAGRRSRMPVSEPQPRTAEKVSRRTIAEQAKNGSEQPTVGCPGRQLMAAGQLQLAQHRRHVRLHGLDRDEKLARHLPVGVTPRD